ncbi:hypothetical protein GYMLUDRAFT_87359 [Collybiopsis luxurians FD-317 M1]|uniref:Uncharacterized protein n=1 Tax=Collybiopsis luxurians FD-317 M1 TaxID=944289 RepID=A0A0D0C1U2_9AGAR|nr:hypothetical protein GYMLUDRAFT_87359 [Collybiopsis luxurians FD-317 M1]
MASFEFRPTSAALRTFKATAKRSDDPLREFADYILKIQQSYDESLPDDIKHLIAVVYEFGLAKIEGGEKTDPRELDRLVETAAIVASTNVTSSLQCQRLYFENELAKVVEAQPPPLTDISATPIERSPSIIYQSCNWYHAGGEVYVTTNNDNSVNSHYHTVNDNSQNSNITINNYESTPSPPFHPESPPTVSSELDGAASKQSVMPKVDALMPPSAPVRLHSNDIPSKTQIDDHQSGDHSVSPSSHNSGMSRKGSLDAPGTGPERIKGYSKFWHGPLKYIHYHNLPSLLHRSLKKMLLSLALIYDGSSPNYHLLGITENGWNFRRPNVYNVEDQLWEHARLES